MVNGGYNGAYDRMGRKIHGGAKQAWFAGAQVKVGFLTLRVIGRMPTPGDGLPDEWLLSNEKGQHYSFQPHLGLTKITDEHFLDQCRGRVRAFAEAA